MKKENLEVCVVIVVISLEEKNKERKLQLAEDLKYWPLVDNLRKDGNKTT